MPRNVPAEEKIKAVKEYLDGKGSLKTIGEKYSVGEGSFRKWLAKYKADGEVAFLESGHNLYSAELKESIIYEYLSQRTSLTELAIKYKIPSSETIRMWILKYNSHEEIKSSRKGGIKIMTKGRKTTLNERIEIVEYCIAHEHNYAETAEKYEISYQQARNYTIKYETNGISGLEDNRGRNKPEDEMTEVEKLRAENKLLKAQKQRAEMEVSFLKKLAEIERRRG